MTKVLNVPYAIDLGNGFTKRTHGSEVIIEPSAFSMVDDFFQYQSDAPVIDKEYLIGEDAITQGRNISFALGDTDLDRYFDESFQRLLLGFIAKDFADVEDRITISLLVLGLPLNHFSIQAKVAAHYTGKKVININNNDLIVDIKEVAIVPQPVGTYMHLVDSKKVDPSKGDTLIVDGGFGTLDITAMRKFSVVERAADNLGVSMAYKDIFNILATKFSSLPDELSVGTLPFYMEHGFSYQGSQVIINDIPEVKKILDNHFNQVFQFIRSQKFRLETYQKVIFTGGMALLHKDRIEDKNKPNYVVLENGQEANVLGYLSFGKVKLKNEKEKTTSVR